MRELVDADSASLPTASTGGDAPQRSEMVSRGNRWYTTAAENVGPEAKRAGMLGGSREYAKVSMMETSRRGGRCCIQHVEKSKARIWVDT